MLNYSVIGLIFVSNLIIYLIITLPLDFFTYTRGTIGRKHIDGPKVKMDLYTVITFCTSFYMWVLFILIPIDALFKIKFFYMLIFKEPEIIIVCLQIMGIILIYLATLVACWGRITRGRRAFSWGIPKNLEKNGMYRYIRHPLYASYCYYFIGFLLVLQSLIITPLLLGILGYYKLSLYEEKILIENFGEEYISYQKKVGRFFPRLL